MTEATQQFIEQRRGKNVKLGIALVAFAVFIALSVLV